MDLKKEWLNPPHPGDQGRESLPSCLESSAGKMQRFDLNSAIPELFYQRSFVLQAEHSTGKPDGLAGNTVMEEDPFQAPVGKISHQEGCG
jgi:hypothetical protein